MIDSLAQHCLPPGQAIPGSGEAPLSILGQPGRDDPRFSQSMVEYDQSVVKPDMAIGQFEIVHRSARKAWFDEVLQIVTPIAETAPEGEGKIELVKQFASGHESVK